MRNFTKYSLFHQDKRRKSQWAYLIFNVQTIIYTIGGVRNPTPANIFLWPKETLDTQYTFPDKIYCVELQNFLISHNNLQNSHISITPKLYHLERIDQPITFLSALRFNHTMFFFKLID